MKKLLLALCVCPFLLSGCGLGMAAGAGAAVGTAAVSEGGIGGTAKDIAIQAQINELWFSHDIEMFRKLDLTVNQGRVLITGIVQDPEHRVEAVRLAWQPSGVTQVINEIRVAEEGGGVMGFARDTWITTQIRTKITFDRDILSINYNIETVQGTVYLMGVAQSQRELNRVIETARTVADVKQVVSYVKVRGDAIESSGTDYNSAPVMQGAGASAPSQPQGYSNEPAAAAPYDDGGNYGQSYYGSGQPDSLNSEATAAPVRLEPVQAEPIY
jgi:osmotically-inducible protein OsmY